MMWQRISVTLAAMAVLLINAPGISHASDVTELDEADRAKLETILAADHRTPEFAARDGYRNPAAVLDFFGVEPGMTVVEIWPATGWWTEILAPWLRDKGTYYAAGFAVSQDITPQWRVNMQREFEQKLAAEPAIYDQVQVTEIGPTAAWEPVPPGSADRVLAFRNFHNWIRGDYEDEMLEAIYRSLRPGGVLGLVQHRAKPGTTREQSKDIGYVDPAYIIERARAAGFELQARSEINANPKDIRDHPEGVWTLTPSLRYCEAMDDDDERNACEARYREIGESDRMTLRFLKPDDTGAQETSGFMRLVAGIANTLRGSGPGETLEGEAFSMERFEKLQAEDAVILIDIWASWCPTCAKQRDVLAEYQTEHPEANLHILEIDYDGDRDLVRHVRAPRQSTLILYRGDERYWYSVAETRRDKIFAAINQAVQAE